MRLVITSPNNLFPVVLDREVTSEQAEAIKELLSDTDDLCAECGIYPRVETSVGGVKHLCQQCLDRARLAFTKEGSNG